MILLSQESCSFTGIGVDVVRDRASGCLWCVPLPLHLTHFSCPFVCMSFCPEVTAEPGEGAGPTKGSDVGYCTMVIKHQSQCRPHFIWVSRWQWTKLWWRLLISWLLFSHCSLCLSFVHDISFLLVHLIACFLATCCSSLHLTLAHDLTMVCLQSSGVSGPIFPWFTEFISIKHHAPWLGTCTSLLFWEQRLKLTFAPCYC